jgi:2-methylisocitrate lyase-like PEP mutase family enzyme
MDFVPRRGVGDRVFLEAVRQGRGAAGKARSPGCSVRSATLASAEQIGPVVALGAPVNVVLLPGGPNVETLAARGARRISVGGSLASIAQGAMVASAEHLLAHGTFDADAPFIAGALNQKAFTTG